MANLKQDLDKYLLLNSEQKKTFKIEMKLPPMKVPGIGKLFGSSEPEANSWLKDTQHSCFLQLSRIQRIIGFITCLGLGILFMTMSTFYIPVLILKARKFALLYTLGSFFCIFSFSFLSGFMAFMRSLFSKERLIISLSYMVSLIATIYFAIFVQSTGFTVLFAVVQVISLLFMILSAIPGGTSGLKFFGQIFRYGVSQSLPV